MQPQIQKTCSPSCRKAKTQHRCHDCPNSPEALRQAVILLWRLRLEQAISARSGQIPLYPN